MPLTFADDSASETAPEFFGKFVKVGLAVDFDGSFCSVANYVAVMAPLEMVFQFGLGLGIHRPIEVVG